jgi:hypothetical protein
MTTPQKPRKMSYPQLCRAEGSAIAYRTALDLIRRKPVDEVIRLLELKYKEKSDELAVWRQQKEQEHTDRSQRAYVEANRENDDL